jgi:hypothetical protein
MTDMLDDLAHFPELRFRDRSDRDDIPEREILFAISAWIRAGRSPLRISITYHADGSVSVDRIDPYAVAPEAASCYCLSGCSIFVQQADF